MPDPSEPQHFFSTAESFTYTGRPAPPSIPVLHAGDDSSAGYFASLDNFTFDARSAATPDVVIEPPQPKPDNPANPPTSTD